MDRGMRKPRPARDSLGSSICGTTCTACRFHCMPWDATRSWRVPPLDGSPGLVKRKAIHCMRFPLRLTATMTTYIAGRRLRRVEKFPLVMMLEPLHACNLTCTGCGRIREYRSTITEKLTVEQCLVAVEECGAPIVSICGGEPTIYPELHTLVSELLARKRHI